MHLHEEYIARCNLDIPVILFKQRSTVLIRSKNPPYTWHILAFSWREPDRHPGFFEMSYSEALHDGYDKGNLLFNIVPVEYCHWDEYESAVLRMTAVVKKSGFGAVKINEQPLAIWAIFLTMYDSWLAEHLSLSFFDLVEVSLNPEVAWATRMKACVMAQKQLIIDSKVNDVWLCQLLPLAKNNSEWLVNLIND